jgi:flagellar protein FliO/FliZ
MASTLWSVLMLLVVLALIPLVLWLLKKLQNVRPGGAGPALQVAGQLALGARERVVLVRVGERLLVLGVTPQQVALLAEADAGAAPATPAGEAAPGFIGLLRTALSRPGAPQ